MNYKKLASAALTVTTVLWMVGAAALPLANAQTTDASLAATISSLQAQIASLTAELNTSGTTTASVGATTYDFTSDLTVGSTGSAVTALQTFLIGQGDLVLATPTQYFGSMTQAALAKFQAAHSITPSVGYFGPKTRAFVNSLSTSTSTTTTTTVTLPAGCTSTTGYSVTTGAACSTPVTLPTGCTSSMGYSPTTGASCATGATGVMVATGAPMTIAIDPQTPGAQNLAAGAVDTPVLKLDFTAGATPVTVTNLVLTRTGLSQDNDLDNVYLYSGATKLASNLGFNNGAITFSNGAGLFTVPANSTMVVTVTADIDKGGTGTTASDSGHIFQIGLTSAANVTGGTFTGNFPFTSAQFTIASVSNLATLTVSGVQNASTSVNAGQLDDLVGQMTVQAGNNPVKVTALNFTNVGSVTPSYLQNLKLMDGSTQLGATISSLGTNNIATFDLSGAPLMLTSGQSAVLSLYADITGGVNRSFQFSIQQSSDVQAVDTTYGVGIGASFQSGGSFPIDFSNVTINNGGVVASRDASSPTTYAVAGNTNQVLAKFDVLASGDSIKFTQLDFLTTGGNTINNFRVVDDQGAQIGTTQNTSGGEVQEGSGSLNYIVPANTTRVLTVYGDLGSNASGTVQVTFGYTGTAAQSYTTYANAPVSAINGNTLSILPANTNLLVNENYGLGSPVSAPAGAQGVEIGSYTLTAGQVNGINLTGVTIVAASALSTNNWLTNLYVMDGSTQIGQTYAQVTGGNGYSFNSNSPIAIPASGSITLNVYANVSSNSTSSTLPVATTLSNVNASTQAGQAVTAISTPGQDIQFTSGGILSGSLSAGTSQASYLGMGIAGVNVGQYQFVADNNGSETVTQVVLTDSATTPGVTTQTHPSDLINYRLTDSSGNQLGTASEVGGTLTFNLTGLVVPSNSTQYVNLVADTNSYPYATSGGTHAYILKSYNYTNASMSVATTTTSNNAGNLFTVYQTTLGVAGASFSNPNSVSGVGNIVGEFNFTAGSGNMNPIVKTITLSTGGSLISSSTSQTLGLYDSSAPSVLLASSTMNGTQTSTFTMAGNNWTLPYSSTRTLLVETLATPTGLVSQTNNGGSYQVLLKGVTWNDGTGVTVNSLSPAISIPVASQNITNLSN
ncbi:MAG: peptidoglycan-binding domain-containing protein [Minisyncoccia bacterium]